VRHKQNPRDHMFSPIKRKKQVVKDRESVRVGPEWAKGQSSGLHRPGNHHPSHALVSVIFHPASRSPLKLTHLPAHRAGVKPSESLLASTMLPPKKVSVPRQWAANER
jgi:hypothetical protein